MRFYLASYFRRHPLVGLWMALALLLAGCTPGSFGSVRSFQSNGEQIYLTGTSSNGPVHSNGGELGGMMGRGMMGSNRLACADCHGNDAQGGVHMMHMQVMDAPDIRWRSLTEENGGSDGHSDGEDGHEMDHAPYTPETFAQAVRQGLDPDREPLDSAMPRWQLSDRDVADLIEYLDRR